jgi:hypothetical protein
MAGREVYTLGQWGFDSLGSDNWSRNPLERMPGCLPG